MPTDTEMMAVWVEAELLREELEIFNWLAGPTAPWTEGEDGG